ncbi:NADH dehydrogenase [ubiquinone] 1 alpha subcomplex assembly factor 4 [Tiliqua scincoides]|uniref:NADH dehydrogenase [ubiquinone] 1 alpha subcomplex assembly factor 4 n=1 Tax=Tiliqua scincoides TaxID=71010 RepID=UPI003462E921
MMGARVTRVWSNFNLESRAHREISKAKPAAAPRHPGAAVPLQHPAQFQEEIKKKDEQLLTLLKDVYVDSKEPSVNVQNKGGILPSQPEERRLTKVGHLHNLDVQTVPKGRISVVEVLTLLSNHHHSPKTWTAEKLAKEYCLDLKDVTALLAYFIPFAVEIFTSEDKKSLKPN